VISLFDRDREGEAEEGKGELERVSEAKLEGAVDIAVEVALSLAEPASPVAEVAQSALEVAAEVAPASGASVVDDGDIAPASPPPSVPIAKMSESQYTVSGLAGSAKKSWSAQG
jgi:hypothetical protein